MTKTTPGQYIKGRIYVDGIDLLDLEHVNDAQFSTEKLEMVLVELKRMGYEPKAVVDDSVLFEINNEVLFENILQLEDVQLAPINTDMEYYILNLAQVFNSKIVTNDLYEEYQEKFPWIEERRVTVSIKDGLVQFSENLD